MILTTALGCALVHSPIRAESPRYAAMLADGTRLAGSKLTDWHAAGSQPKLDGRPLGGSQNRWRWIVDRHLELEEPPAKYIEFFGGDRLPCRVINYQKDTLWPGEPLPPHLLVQIADRLSSGGGPSNDQVRVVMEYVRRIVWNRRGRQRYEPGSLYLLNGQRLTFRAVRFQTNSLVALGDNDQRELLFSEIAEIHLHEPAPWEAYYRELAALGASSRTHLLQIESTTGLTVTTSTERFRPLGTGNAADSKSWVHAVGPAWSWDTLLVPTATVRVRRQFAWHQVPLSRLNPDARGNYTLAGVWA